MTLLKESVLIKECKRNNYTAQMQVYNLYKHRLYNASWRLFNKREDAEDAVQEAFIKGFQKINQLEDAANLGAWLHRIVVNHSLDIIWKRKNIWVEDMDMVQIEEGSDDIEENNEISIDFIKNCIESLSDKYRVILMLYLIENYNHREISELLQLKESTVRNQYIRGKAKLLNLIKINNHHEIKGIYSK